jgi:outer membrane protein, heavy metal efflux system
MLLPLLLVAISIDEAVDRAIRRHPDVQVARAGAAVARAQFTLAGVLPQPEFRLSQSNFDLDDLTARERLTVGLRFSLPRPREISLKRAMARVREDAIKAEIKATEAKVAAETRLLFRRALLASRRAELARKKLDLLRRKHKVISTQVKAGLKEAELADLAEFAAEDTASELRRLTTAAASAREQLARLIGADAGFTLEADPLALSVTAEPLDATRLELRAVTERGDVESLRHTCRQFEYTRKLALDQRYPWLSFAQVSHRVTYLPERGPWGWQIGVDLPVFRSGAREEAKLAAAQQARCNAQREALIDQIRAEVDAAVKSLEQLRLELLDIDRLRTGVGQRALDRVKAALAQGHAESADLLEAEIRMTTLEERWLDRRSQYLTAEAQLETALGS